VLYPNSPELGEVSDQNQEPHHDGFVSAEFITKGLCRFPQTALRLGETFSNGKFVRIAWSGSPATMSSHKGVAPEWQLD
jgi:hypothetical protein